VTARAHAVDRGRALGAAVGAWISVTWNQLARTSAATAPPCTTSDPMISARLRQLRRLPETKRSNMVTSSAFDTYNARRGHSDLQ